MTDKFFKPRKNEREIRLKINWEEMLYYVKGGNMNAIDEINLICQILQARSLDNAYEYGFPVIRAE